jgi:predicted DNA-binding ArsR family transcriptional regulator
MPAFILNVSHYIVTNRLCRSMNRIKVINEPSELVPMLRSVDTPVKRDVLKEVTLEWKTADAIEDKFGPEGKDAIIFFEKMKLVETRWQSSNGSYPEKLYHSYYSSFNINAQWPVYEISDVLAAAMMGEEEYGVLEAKILEQVGKDGRFSGDVAEALGLSSTMLKSLVRRSVKMDYRGHRIEMIREG